MAISIVGVGLVSPGGTTLEEHAFFLRAGLLALAPSPFLDANDERIDVRLCPWVEPRSTIGSRIAALATSAAAEAIEHAKVGLGDSRVPVMLCMDHARPGLPEECRAEVRARVMTMPSCGEVTLYSGAADAFRALSEAAARIEAGHARAVLVLAADSFVSLEFVSHHIDRATSLWLMRSPPPSEGAAAILLTKAESAKRNGFEMIGRLHGAAVERGVATDDNDEPTNGAAMSAALRAVPSPGRFGMAFGQHEVDMLRMRDWHFATARNAARFADPCSFESLEAHVGRLGAAAGLANFVWGLGTLRHDVQRDEAWRRLPFCAWALSREGTRGVAAGTWESR